MNEPFPQPRRQDGKPPCGECHLKPGETCDICGAVEHRLNADVWKALEESVRLQRHYAQFLNALDDGDRRTFYSAEEWMERLREVGMLK